MNNFTLKRNEIIRGFKQFENILENGSKINCNNLVAYKNANVTDSDYCLRVGFLLAKKKL